MKVFFIFLAIIFCSHSLLADSIKSTPVGPGIIHHHEVITAGPWEINVLEIDRTNPWIKFETVKS